MAADGKKLRFNYFASLGTASQVERFCWAHELSAESCRSVAELVKEQAGKMTAEQEQLEQEEQEQEEQEGGTGVRDLEDRGSTDEDLIEL